MQYKHLLHSKPRPDLGSLISRQSVAENVIFDIPGQLCMGLHYCHGPSSAAGDIILHRHLSRRTVRHSCIGEELIWQFSCRLKHIEAPRFRARQGVNIRETIHPVVCRGMVTDVDDCKDSWTVQASGCFSPVCDHLFRMGSTDEVRSGYNAGLMTPERTNTAADASCRTTSCCGELKCGSRSEHPNISCPRPKQRVYQGASTCRCRPMLTC